MIKTIHLTNAEIEISGIEENHVHIQNSGPASVYVSQSPGIEPEGDGVLRIFGGKSGTMCDVSGNIYLKGSDDETVTIYANNDIRSPFN